MKFQWTVNRLPFALILLAVIQLLGCGVKALPYTGKAGLDTSNMTPQKVDVEKPDTEAEFLLPPGWTFEAVDPFTTTSTTEGFFSPGQGKLGVLKKEGTSANIAVFCWGMWILPDYLPGVGREAIKAAIPDAKLIKGTYEIDVPGYNSYFEVYSGTGILEGQQVPLYGYHAWKDSTSMFRCKYTLVGAAGQIDGDEVEDDFIAIVRSLKN